MIFPKSSGWEEKLCLVRRKLRARVAIKTSYAVRRFHRGFSELRVQAALGVTGLGVKKFPANFRVKRSPQFGEASFIFQTRRLA